LEKSSAAAVSAVPHFGDWDAQVLASNDVMSSVQPIDILLEDDHHDGKTSGSFAIPFNLEESQDMFSQGWILAEDSKMENNLQKSMASSEPDLFSQSIVRDEEEWGAFDPSESVNILEEEEKKEKQIELETEGEVEESPTKKQKLTSEPNDGEKTEEELDSIELGRREDDSITSSQRQSNRPSLLNDESLPMQKTPPLLESEKRDNDTESRVVDFIQPQAEEEALDFEVAPEAISFSSPPLSPTSASSRPSLHLEGTPLTNTTSVVSPPSETSTLSRSKPKRKRLRKRKVVIDNDETELSSEFMKNMLRDTSDLLVEKVLRRHPADVPTSEGEKEGLNLHHLDLSMEELLARPNLGDDGQLAPELLEVWDKNTRILVGDVMPFQIRHDAELERKKQQIEKEMEEFENEEVELARDGETSKEEDEFGMGKEEIDFNSLEKGAEKDTEELNLQLSFNGDEENNPPAVAEGFEEEQYFEADVDASSTPGKGSIASHSSFSLGHVNALEQDLFNTDEDEVGSDQRQNSGTELVSSSAKWHPHTVKVFGMLKRNMTDGERNELSYDEISKGCSRKTAASVFFELLQLKTWDFIEVHQDESYADIQVQKGARFVDDPPSN